MAKADVYTLDVPEEATGAGAPQNITGLRNVRVQVGGSGTWTIETELTLNGTDWFSVKSSTAPDMFALPHSARQIRANVTAHTAGQPTMVVEGEP